MKWAVLIAAATLTALARVVIAESIPHAFMENFQSFSQREITTFKTREEAMDWLVKD